MMICATSQWWEDQSAWTQVGKWCALIEGALYFLREGWLGDFIFTGIMITSFFNFFLKFYRINRSESVKMWIWYNFIIFLVLFILKMWPSWISCECEKNLDISFFIMHEKAPYFYVTEFYKRVSGTLLIDECDDWIGKILCVRWAWGKMRSVFLHHLTFNLADVFTCERKQSHPLHPGFSTLNIRPLCLEYM